LDDEDEEPPSFSAAPPLLDLKEEEDEEDEALEKEDDGEASDGEESDGAVEVDPSMFVDDAADDDGTGNADDDADEENDEYEADFINDAEEVVQGGVDMRDSGGECKMVALTIRELYNGTRFRAIYSRPDGSTAYADVKVPPRTAPGTLLPHRHFDIRVCHEEAEDGVGAFSIRNGSLMTTAQVKQREAIAGPATITVHTPDNKEHRVPCGMGLLTGDIIPAPGLGFGGSDMLCEIKVVSDRLNEEKRARLREFIKSL